MFTPSQQTARKVAAQAQVDFESTVAELQEQIDSQLEAARIKRRAAFQRARDTGLTLKAIGEAVGLDRSTVGEILRRPLR